MTKWRGVLGAPMFLFGTTSSTIMFTLAIYRLSGSVQEALVLCFISWSRNFATASTSYILSGPKVGACLSLLFTRAEACPRQRRDTRACTPDRT